MPSRSHPDPIPIPSRSLRAAVLANILDWYYNIV
jgi:hypothetical protein